MITRYRRVEPTGVAHQLRGLRDTVQFGPLRPMYKQARERVRSLQREYVDLWVAQLRRHRRGLTLDQARSIAHATFGLINSTPHSRLLPDDDMRPLLRAMTSFV